MPEREVAESFQILRDLTPEFAHELIDALERKMVTDSMLARIYLLSREDVQDEFSRKVEA